MPILPADVEALSRALGDMYRATEAELNRELKAILTDPRQYRRKRRLQDLLAETRRRQLDLVSEARAILNDGIPVAWSAGAQAAGVGNFTWTQGHRQAAGALARDTFGEVLRATDFMSKDLKALIREAGAQQARFKVASGQTAKQAGSALERRLLQTGITAVTYRDGRNIRASTYAEMLMRTKTAVAYNMGGLNQIVKAGIRYVEVADGADCGLTTHGDGHKPNGHIYTAEFMSAFPISHPNCRRDIVPRPDVNNLAEAREADSLRPPEQRADQARFEKYLQEKAERRAARRQRVHRIERKQRTPRSSRERIDT